MANVMLVANLNCDRVLQLEEPLLSGGRHHYQDEGRRLGGGGANTGLGLVWAGHNVSLVSQVGRDETADWLLAEASLVGLNCALLQRNDIVTPELLLLMTPDGERTIIRPGRPEFVLPAPPSFKRWDALYVNSSAIGIEAWAEMALADTDTLVVAQLPKSDESRPCHVLITSRSDLLAHTGFDGDVWGYGWRIAGEHLRYVVVTDGGNGATAYSQDGKVSVPALPVDVVDTTGAGDNFAGGMIHGLLSGHDIATSMTEGAQWAAFAVQTVSSVPGDNLREYLSE
ncbi:ribokinase [Photobacterium aquae]|uniref:Ribokinase n=1 Tax=Photobacterium aquae TaxID=1195763 RepID=A0A0J1GUI4_9GAMM|nr:PfkB family carbohydrate kinase [Photobacterium aquae]KLV03383.1 ribokinase [Photobacterium aquae]